MAGLKEIRTRIVSVKSTMQITSAMKMVAAAKLRKAQDKIIQLRPYAAKLEGILECLTNDPEDRTDNIYTRERELKNLLVVVITSNRGLCGAFNSNVIKEVISEDTNRTIPREEDLHYLTIGKKGTELLRSRKFPIIDSNYEIYDDLQFNTVAPLADRLIHHFINGEYDKIEFVYNHFKNAAVQIVTREQFLPITFDEDDENRPMQTDFILEPDRALILEKLIPRSLRIQLYKAILDSYVAEQGARMTAMHMATDNATELLRELTLHYNKARQSAITKEILDIVGGAEALHE
ncbi:MAG: ATP synthase F1 subunit gamma [Bacteroidales bacterium]|nr:MAG: ATP synthase F1 subunit gamma [Bacteroidales bacterium]